MNNTIQHLYVNMPGHTPCFDTITQALESLSSPAAGAAEDMTENASPEAKSFPAPEPDVPPVILHIGSGCYREKLVVTRPNLTFQGEGDSRGDVRIVYGDAAMDVMPEGDNRGTFRTASVRIDTHDFTARHLTFENDAGSGASVGQALALYVDGDRNYFCDCALKGHQDTLFTAPLPEQEMVAGGFKGPGDGKPRTMGRQCYRDCYIDGDVDFIFGSAIAYFENCEIFSRMRENKKPATPGDRVTCGYVTAASTPKKFTLSYPKADPVEYSSTSSSPRLLFCPSRRL